MNLQFSSRFWYPLGKLKSLLRSLEEWKAFILFLATSLTCWKSLKLEMASSNGFKCASFSSSLHKLKKSDHHLSILWSPPKSAWEVVTPNSSNFPPYSLYFNDLVLLFFRGYCNFESERALGFWNHGYWYKIIIEKSVMTAISDIQNSTEFCSHSWRILCTSASLVEKLECRALVFYYLIRRADDYRILHEQIECWPEKQIEWLTKTHQLEFRPEKQLKTAVVSFITSLFFILFCSTNDNFEVTLSIKARPPWKVHKVLIS